jgi:hypothetical protein
VGGGTHVDYGNIVGEAWRLTWRYRSLWWLGLLATQSAAGISFNNLGGFPGGPPLGGAPGNGSGGTSSAGAGATDLPDAAAIAQRVTDFLQQYAGVIAGVLVAVVLVGLLLWFLLLLLSSVAEGGLTRATLDAAHGEPVTLGQAWHAGMRTMWRFVALNLILTVLALVTVLTSIGGIAAVLIGPLTGGGGSKWGFGLLQGGVTVALLLLVVFVLSVIASVVVPLAQRSIVADDRGPVEGLSEGWRLFRSHFWTGIVLWLLSAVMGMLFGFAILMGLLVLAIPLGLIGLLIGAMAGQGLLLYLYIGVVALVALVLVLGAGAVTNTFQWHYWTQAYLRLAPHISSA